MHRLAVRGDQALAIEERDARTRLIGRESLIAHRAHEKLCDARRGRAGAEEQETLQAKRSPGDAKCAEHTGEGHGCRPLDVVIEATHLVAVTLEKPHRVVARPILELDAAPRELLLHGFDELVDEGVELVVAAAPLPQAEVERVAEELLIVGPGVDEERQGVLRRDAAGGRIERELSDRDAHAVRAEIAEAKDALAARHDDEPHVSLGPIPEDLPEMAAPFDRDVEAAWASEEMSELLAGLADRRRVYDRHEARRI